MLSTEINEAAVEFGRALRGAPAVAIYRIAAEALEADPVAQGLLADLREHQGTLARTQRAGLTPSQEQIERMRLCQAARSSPANGPPPAFNVPRVTGATPSLSST